MNFRIIPGFGSDNPDEGYGKDHGPSLSDFILFETVIVLIIGLFLGTICTFYHQYYDGYVEKSQTQSLTAAYQSYEKLDSGAWVYFLDSDRLFIDSDEDDHVDFDLLDKVKTGSTVYLLLHPRSHNILELRTEDAVILLFEDTQQDPLWYEIAMWGFGIAFYAAALFALMEILKGFLLFFQKKSEWKESETADEDFEEKEMLHLSEMKKWLDDNDIPYSERSYSESFDDPETPSILRKWIDVRGIDGSTHVKWRKLTLDSNNGKINLDMDFYWKRSDFVFDCMKFGEYYFDIDPDDFSADEAGKLIRSVMQGEKKFIFEHDQDGQVYISDACFDMSDPQDRRKYNCKLNRIYGKTNAVLYIVLRYLWQFPQKYEICDWNTYECIIRDQLKRKS